MIVGFLLRYWLMIVIVCAVAGTGAAAALNSTAMSSGGVGAGVIVSGVPAAQSGFAEGQKAGQKYLTQHNN